MITAIAIDDEPLALSIISAFCSKLDTVKLKGTFTEPSEALHFIKHNPVDLVFLDINMPSLSGIDLYKKISKNTMAIFTTAYSEYAVEGFDLKAIDYLLKPFDFSRFRQAVDKANEYHAYAQHKQHTGLQHIFVRVDYSMVKVDVNDILFIEGLDNYIKIHLTNDKNILVRMSMKAIAEKLSPNDLIRVHRSFIVSLKQVTSVRNKIVYLDTIEIPVGTNYVDEVTRLFKDKG